MAEGIFRERAPGKGLTMQAPAKYDLHRRETASASIRVYVNPIEKVNMYGEIRTRSPKKKKNKKRRGGRERERKSKMK